MLLAQRSLARAAIGGTCRCKRQFLPVRRVAVAHSRSSWQLHHVALAVLRDGGAGICAAIPRHRLAPGLTGGAKVAIHCSRIFPGQAVAGIECPPLARLVEGARIEERPGVINSLFDSSTLPVLEQVVNFTEARHGVLAGNIANLDTPGYRCQDFSPAEFQKQLKEAVEARRRSKFASPGESLDPAWARDDVTGGSTSGVDQLQAVAANVKGMLRHDDNNASLEEQITEIAKNQTQHNLALSLMRAQFSLLRAAITERA